MRLRTALPLLLTALALDASGAPAAAPQLTDAIPADATAAFFAPRVEQGLEEAVQVLERLVGAEGVEAFLSAAPLPFLALETEATGARSGVDVRGGVGIFRSPAFRGWVGVVAVKDGARLLAVLAAGVPGRTLPRPGPGGVLKLESDEALTAAAVVRGHHAFLFMPDDAQADAVRAARAFRARPSGAPALSASARYRRLAPRVSAGQLVLYVSGADVREGHDAALFSLRMGGAAAVLDGVVAGGGTLRAVPGQSPLLDAAPGGPMFVAFFGVPAEDAERLLLGPPGSARRAVTGPFIRQVLSVDLGGALEAVGPPVALLGYFDVGTYLRHYFEGEPPPPEVSWMLHGRRAGEQATTLARLGGAFPGAVRVAFRGDDVAMMTGTPESGRRTESLRARHAARLPEGALGPGHVTLLFDLGALEDAVGAPVPTVVRTDASKAPPASGDVRLGWLDAVTEGDLVRVRGALDFSL